MENSIQQNQNEFVYPEEYEYDNQNFKQFDDNDVGLVIKNKKRFHTKSLGIVIYADTDFYDDNKDSNLTHHLPNRTQVILYIQQMFLKRFKIEVKQIVCGHEHGKENGKCHFQIIVELQNNLLTFVKPSSFTLNGFKYLFMAQTARNNHALKNYCKKDGDFEYLFSDKVMKKVYKLDKEGNPTTNVDACLTLISNPQLTKEEKIDLMKTYAPHQVVNNFRNIEYFIEKNTVEDIPILQWNFPEHLKGKYPLIEDWFFKYCVNHEEDKRCKALLLYSSKRALGKTRFAQSLVNHENYFVIFRNNFNNENLKDKNPKLLILDDMNFFTNNNKESWKALIAGEQCSIRDAYCNLQWNYRVPCIITTNNLIMINQIRHSDEFKTQIIIQEIDTYIGPPGTEPNDLFSIQEELSQNTLEKLQELSKKYQEKQEEKKNAFNLLKKY